MFVAVEFSISNTEKTLAESEVVNIIVTSIAIKALPQSRFFNEKLIEKLNL